MINFLPTMARLGRNSMNTNRLAAVFKEKLTEEEKRMLHAWLLAVEQEKTIEINRAKRKPRF